MSEWQKIETAPKDGTLILVCDKKHEWIITASWDDAETETNHYDKAGWFSNACCDGFMTCNATHWQPLPEPPK